MTTIVTLEPGETAMQIQPIEFDILHVAHHDFLCKGALRMNDLTIKTPPYIRFEKVFTNSADFVLEFAHG